MKQKAPRRAPFLLGCRRMSAPARFGPVHACQCIIKRPDHESPCVHPASRSSARERRCHQQEARLRRSRAAVREPARPVTCADHRQPVRTRAPGLDGAGPWSGHSARPHQGSEGADGRLVPAGSPNRLRRPGRAARQSAHFPAGAGGRDPEAPGNPVRDRGTAQRRAVAREDQGQHRRGRTAPPDRYLAVGTARLNGSARGSSAPVKPTVVRADVLFEDHRAQLKWEWVAGLGASERRFDEVAVRAARSGADLVGYLNYIHPYRVQILGQREIAYLTNATSDDCARRISRIVTLEPPVLVLTDNQVAPDALLSMCERAQIPMFATQEPSAFVIDVLRAYLSKHFAERTSMHGVFMDILGLGVMITGESGLGKSELGLELISRGNGLVADDAVDLFRINQTTIEGRCPELLQNLLEVRGIGLLDIRAIFGETAVRRKMRLKLIVHLVRRDTMEREYERLPYEPLTQDVLGVPVRKAVIQVVAGRNIAVLVEAAVRNTILQLRGVDTYQEFVERHRRAMEQDK